MTRSRHLRAAALVALAWAVGLVPFVVGMASCPTARFFRYPCPGCGMTRALHLLVGGQVGASLAMHPLAAPTLIAHALLAVATVAAAARFGAPWSLVRAGWGRAAIGVAAAVMVLDVALWIGRALGVLGGPVPV